MISLLLVNAFTSNLENLSSIYSFSKSEFFISTDTIGFFGLSTAFKNDIKISGCSSDPKIFLNTKSILGFNKVLLIFSLPIFYITIIIHYIFIVNKLKS